MHRLYPLRLGLLLATVRGEAWWRSEAARRDSQERMRVLVAGTSREAEAPRLARLRLHEAARRQEVVWRPWLLPDLPVRGLYHVREAQALGQGVILSWTHLGDYLGAVAALSHHGLEVHTALATHFYGPAQPGYEGWYLRQLKQRIEDVGGSTFLAPGSFSHIRSLLAEGRIVSLAFDAPGRTATPFLGKRVMLGSGAARAALESGAPIVPFSLMREAIVFRPPLLAESTEGLDHLQWRLANALAPFVLDWPEGLDDQIVLAPGEESGLLTRR